MSAWYVLAASGVHPSCPGNTRMEITSPVFDKVEFRLDPTYYSGKTFTVIAHDNNTNNIYIQKALLNGKEYDKCYLDFADIPEQCDAPHEKIVLLIDNTFRRLKCMSIV